eukprot:COSAG05_NODE_753_length_7528_cov_4.065823_6_plen_427_part_00
MDKNQSGCGHAGYNSATGMGGAYCCLPLPASNVKIASVYPTRFATEGGQLSKPAVVIYNSPKGMSGDVSCRVLSVSGSYTLDWSSARLSSSSPQKSEAEPGDWRLYPVATQINGSAVACAMPSVLVEGPGLLQISLDSNKTWSAGAPVMFYQAILATVSKRPYFTETEGSLILQSDSALKGALLDVSVLLTSSNKTWEFTSIAGGSTNAQLLQLPFIGIPQTLNNDLVVTVTVKCGGTDSPWELPPPGCTTSDNDSATVKVVIYTRLIRAAPPPSWSKTEPVQVDREHVGRLLVSGKPWTGIGYYIKMNPPACAVGAACDVGIMFSNMTTHLRLLAQQGVNMAMIYGLQLYNASARGWLLDQAAAVQVKILLDFPAPPGYKSKTATCGQWQNDTVYRSLVTNTIAAAINHSATLGFFVPTLRNKSL